MQDLITEKKPKENALFRFIGSHRFISAIILCLLFFLIYLPLNRFHIYTGGDDPTICNLISNGEVSIGFMGYFYAWFVSVFQPILPHLNFYYIIQDIICFISLGIINYIFLCRLSAKKGLFYSVLFDIVFFSFYIIVIQFTNTSVVACTAGLACMIYGCICEKRKRFRLIQIIGGAILLLIGSQIRFNPFVSLCLVTVAFGLGVFLSYLFKKKKDIGLKKAFMVSVKRFAKTAVVLVIAAAVVFGTNLLSDTLKQTSPDYQEFYEYNTEVSRVNDYRIANFFANKDFYRSIGIESFAETNVLKKWCVDDDFFTKEKLKQIADYSEIHAGDGIGSRSSLHALFMIIGNGIQERVKSGVIIIYAVVFVVVVFIFWFLWLFAKKKMSVVFPPIAFAAIWGILFAAVGGPFGGADNCNLLLLPICIFTVVTAILYNRYQQIINLCITVVSVALYIYLAISRIHFSAALCIYLPAYVFMIMSLDKNNLRKFNFKKHPKILRNIIAVVLILTSVFTASQLFMKYSYVEYPDDYKEVKEYIESHPDNLFLLDGIYRDDTNFNVLVKKDKPENTISFGGWDKHSRTYRESLEKNGIEHLFPDAIDSNIIVVLFDYWKKPEIIAGKVSNLQMHYNYHYASEGKYVEFEKVKGFSRYEMYKIVTHDLKDLPVE